MDWAKLWLEALSAHSLPGVDFVLLGCNVSCSRFTLQPAEFRHAQNVMRFLLEGPPFSLTKAAARAFTLHGFRHIYTTAMRQLQVPLEVIDDAGHWKRGSEMVKTYDAEDCVMELQSKEKVRAAVAVGWLRAGVA